MPWASRGLHRLCCTDWCASAEEVPNPLIEAADKGMIEPRRVLIWGESTREISKKHKETVCTGACLEDGTPIRLYPIDLRYLEKHRQYQLYDWITVPLGRNLKDPRPESYKVDATKIDGEHLGTDSGWHERRHVVFAKRDWHYECLEDLKARQEHTRHSLGMVGVSEVTKVSLVERSTAERVEHEEKLRALRSRGNSIWRGTESTRVPSVSNKAALALCRRSGPHPCPGHSASILDWGLLELGRRDRPESALARAQALCNLGKYELRLYVGNLFTRQHVFSVMGIWYPIQSHTAQVDLFSPC